jgi:hypothetical protein
MKPWKNITCGSVRTLKESSLTCFLQKDFYTIKFELPTNSGNWCNLQEVADEIFRRLTLLFLPDKDGQRPCHGENVHCYENAGFRNPVLFHECFDGDTGKGLGACHQTGWTALVVRCIENVRNR